MTDPKDPLEEQQRSEAEEEYSFLQEVIKDEAGSRKKIRSGILHMIGYGFIFGIVACFSFFAFKPWMESKFAGDPDTVTIPKDDAQEEPSEGEEPQQTQVVLDADSYRQMLQSLQTVAKESNKSVVEITPMANEEDWAKGAEDKKNSVSGLIVADNSQELLILGKIIPAKEAKSIRVTFIDGRQYEAAIKRQDEVTGFCIYAVPRREIESETWSQIEIAVLGSSNAVIAGDTAIVLGKPFGYANAVGYGIVASSKNYFETTDGNYRLIHTDVAGSSAGSGIIINIRGEVIGIIDQAVLEEDSRNMIAGYGISDIKSIIELLSNGTGVPYTGMYGMDVSEEMAETGLPKGVYVKGVETDSPAMSAGIQSGDIITSIGEHDITSLAGYHNLLMEQQEGSKVVLQGKRQGSGGEYVDVEFDIVVGTKE